MEKSLGVTLVEILTALAVAAVLTGLAVPPMAELVNRHRSAAALNRMIGAVQFTRNAAVTHRTTATLCPGANNQCGRRNHWHEGAMTFADRNRDGRRGADEAVLRAYPALPDGARIYWRSFRNRSYLQITARGLTNWQNGHLLYCPPDGDVRYARQVIINAQGRARLATDLDGDGIIEDAQGRDLVCP
jgi:type IV fimbrial biogenesis protein FimT